MLLLSLAAVAPMAVAFAREASPAMRSSPPTPTPAIEPITISLQALPGYGAAPLTAGFMMSPLAFEDDPLVSYQWNFGDGQVSNLPAEGLFHTFKNPGSYVVTLTVTTASGRIASAMTGVIVRPPAR